MFFTGEYAKASQGHPGPSATPEDGNLLGRVRGRATRTGREIKTPAQDGSRGNSGLLILEKKDEARHANTLQTFKGKL